MKMGNNPSSGPYLERQFSQASGQDAATIQVTKRKERYICLLIYSISIESLLRVSEGLPLRLPDPSEVH